MVKFGKNKFRALNKIAKSQKAVTPNVSNKVIKKKLNAEKKVSFQKEVLLKEASAPGSELVNNVSFQEILLDKLSKKPKAKKAKREEPEKKSKVKAVEKQKKRQKTQISDTKLLLKLMMKK